jgi:hypothetical protein
MSTFRHEPLPAEWIDRLFGRFAVRFGQDWIRMWEGIDLAAVKADWSQQLAGMHLTPAGIERLRYGYENLPERPPTAAAFKAVCNRAPETLPKALPAPTQIDSEKARRLRSLVVGAFQAPKEPRQWAHRLKARHEAGERLSQAQIDAYTAALRALPEEVAA